MVDSERSYETYICIFEQCQRLVTARNVSSLFPAPIISRKHCLQAFLSSRFLTRCTKSQLDIDILTARFKHVPRWFTCIRAFQLFLVLRIVTNIDNRVSFCSNYRQFAFFFRTFPAKTLRATSASFLCIITSVHFLLYLDRFIHKYFGLNVLVH